eukprot:365255-Chlamydomonas_euryale.AAC.11
MARGKADARIEQRISTVCVHAPVRACRGIEDGKWPVYTCVVPGLAATPSFLVRTLTPWGRPARSSRRMRSLT